MAVRRLPQPRPGDEDDIRRLLTGRLGARTESLTRQSYGHGSVTWKASTSRGTFFVRTSDRPDIYRSTASNLEQLRDLGLPVPHVLVQGTTGSFAYLVTDAFTGRDLGFEIGTMSTQQSAVLAEQVVCAQRLAGTLPAGQAFGFGPVGAGGPHRSWLEVVRADRDTAATHTPFTARTLLALDHAAERLATIDAVCFLDDLTTKNVIVSDGELTGFVDFDVVCFGDPMYWLALTQVAMLHDVGEAAQFYVDELRRVWAPTDLERANLALYSAVHACEFLSWDDPREQIAARMHPAVEQWLSQAQ